MRTVRLSNKLPDGEADALAGTLLGTDSYDVLVTGEDVDVLKPDGTPLLKFRHGAVARALCAQAYRNLRDAATLTDNRGLAGGADVAAERATREPLVPTYLPGGALRDRGPVLYSTIKEDGTRSRQMRSGQVRSGIVGYFERQSRFPYCRTTAYALQHPERFAQAVPFLQACADAFAREVPDRYAAQLAAVQATHPDFVIPGSVFTTITVNKNWQTAVHKDVGDLAAGFGVIAAFAAGKFDGGYLCFPAYRVAVNMRTTDLLLCDVHEWHGNTPLEPSGVFERISVVLYYREKMQGCSSAEEELQRVKRRQQGTPLYA